MSEKRLSLTKDKMLISTADVCQVFGVSRQTLTDWEKAGLKKHSRGWWDLAEVVSFRGLGSTGAVKSRVKTLAERKLAAEISLKESQGELSRLKNEIMAGKYLEEYYVESELKRFFTVFKRSCMNLARKVSGQAAAYVEPDVARRLEHEIHKIITESLEQLSIGGIINGKK